MQPGFPAVTEQEVRDAVDTLIRVLIKDDARPAWWNMPFPGWGGLTPNGLIHRGEKGWLRLLVYVTSYYDESFT